MERVYLKTFKQSMTQMKLYTEKQVMVLIRAAFTAGQNHNSSILGEQFELITPIELPSIEEIQEAALKQFPYPIDIKDKNDEIIKTRGVKPFNHAKIEKYRTAFTIGAKYMCSKIQGDK